MKRLLKLKWQLMMLLVTLGMSWFASAQTTWTTCASEGGTCSFTGTRSVRYGAGSLWTTKTLTGSTACTNAVFGDPAPGVVKSCQYSSTTTTTTTTAVASSWTRCALENQTCSFSGTRQVRYGANGIFNIKTLTGPVACNNTTFGDPIPGAQKACDYSSTVTTTSTTLAPSTTTTTVPQTVTTTTLPVASGPVGSTVSVSYSENQANIPNPERGFYHQTDCGAYALNTTTMQTWRNTDGNTLIRCYFYLKNYKSSSLPQSVLDFFQSQMNTLRAGGMKTVLRFAYTESTTGDDAPLSIVLTHINQLAPYIQANSDVIANLEAGFIGAWGEWVFSQNFGNLTGANSISAQNWSDRKAVMDKLLSVVPANRMIKLRTAFEKRTMYGTTALASTEAFNQSTRARIGFHNDCFLASSNDYGTYYDMTNEYPFQSNDTKYTPMGGETCQVNAPRSDCPTALQEMTNLHFSDINQDFETNVLNNWKTQGCFTTMKQKLGYRFVLINGTYTNSASVGGTIGVAFNLVNRGFASPFNPRNLELILRNTSTGAVFRLPLSADPRRWLPGSTITVSQNLQLPSNLPAGNYSMLLNLPDPEAKLYSKAQYAIQLANNSTWEASTGFNNLGVTLAVSP